MLSTVFFARLRSRKGYNYWDYFRMEIYSKMKEVKGKVVVTIDGARETKLG